MSEEKEKLELIKEISHRIKYLLNSAEFSDEEKLTIAKNFFRSLNTDNGEVKK